MLTVRLRVLADTGWAVEAGQRVRVHLGTAEVMARCAVLEGDVLAPGEEGWVQLRLEAPVLARGRDALVVRSYSPVTTIAGGRVAEVHPPRRGSLAPELPALMSALLAGDGPGAVGAAAALAGDAGIDVPSLPVLTGLPPGPAGEGLDALVAAGGRRCGDRALAPGVVASARGALLDAVDRHHRDEPLRPGLPAEALRATLPGEAPPELADLLIAELADDGALAVASGVVSRPGYQPRLTPEQERIREELRSLYREAGLAPPAVGELPEALRRRADLWPLLRLLEGEEVLTPVEHGLYVWTATLVEAARSIGERLGGREGLGPADFREVLPVTRKHLMPLLAWFDGRGVTLRREGGREVPVPGQAPPGRVPPGPAPDS